MSGDDVELIQEELQIKHSWYRAEQQGVTMTSCNPVTFVRKRMIDNQLN